MISRLRRLVPLLFLGLLLCSAGCGSKGSEAAPPSPPETEISRIPAPEKRAESAYKEVRIYFDGLLSDRGYYDNETLYMAPEALCRYFGLEPETRIEGDSFEISFPGLILKGEKGQEYMLANGRFLYTPTFYLQDNIESSGRIYLPEDVIERVFGIELDFSPEKLECRLDYGVLALIKGGENYYVANFPDEELYWLSRIIYAEAKDQPMAGLIGVGNVVYNRVESDEFPHTVFDVIFDRKHRVQFDPAATGGVLGEPDRRSEIAACLCMEGYNTVGDSMYFLNPDKGDSSWFEKDLEFVVSLGDHDFYR